MTKDKQVAQSVHSAKTSQSESWLHSAYSLQSAPIGVFDSGVGGLAVARHLKRFLPGEDFIFFGDTAHLPYGDRDRWEVLTYTKEIVHFLRSRQIKALVVACNTAFTAASEWLRSELTTGGGQIEAGAVEAANGGCKLPIIVNVVDPVAKLVSETYDAAQCVGLVGTKLTVAEGVYERHVRQWGGQCKLCSWALPELVPLIEQEMIDREAVLQLLQDYAQRFDWHRLDGLILGCTHYPLVREQFQAAVGNQVRLWDAGVATAKTLKEQLMAHGLLAHSNDEGGERQMRQAAGRWRFYLTAKSAKAQRMMEEFWHDGKASVQQEVNGAFSTDLSSDRLSYLNWQRVAGGEVIKAV